MMSADSTTKLTLPALRGQFGNWIYYSCLMPIREIGKRVAYAKQLHPAEELSKLIQRALEGRRSVEIANYLTQNDERFFNSLVLAVYGGHPDWLEIGISGSATPRASLDELTQETRDSIGFLRLSGREEIFAIDGQHRLSGIKEAMKKDDSSLGDEVVPVIFVGHENSVVGLRRTRRLFTTLNKTAVPVRKRDIIALDEDDVMAITARTLYEEDPRFGKTRIAMIATSSLPPASSALTTIGNLYDILKLVFMHESGKSRDTTLRFNRPDDDRLAEYRKVAEQYFEGLSKKFAPLSEYYRAKDPAVVARKYRSASGGHLLFRPVGLELITRAIVLAAKEKSINLAAATQLVSKIETEISDKPYVDVIWNDERGTVNLRGKTLARRLIFYMIGVSNIDPKKLLADYREFVGDPRVGLPKQVV